MPPILIRVLALAVLTACAKSPPTAASPLTVPVTGDTARADSVLLGLRTAFEIAGRPPVRWTLEERMAHYNTPGASIAVVENGRVVWARGVGVREAGKPEPVTPATLFQAASISKPVTATAMLRLVERGALDLDADVNRYLTSWQLPENRFTAAEKVTLRRLVSHNAGLTVHGFPGYAPGTLIPTVVQVLDGAAPANTKPVRVDTLPGSIGRYSGGGTTVMQQILVDVTGEAFPELMRRLVLEPAGMERSTYEQPLPASRADAAARGHDPAGAVVPGGWHVYPEQAAAGLWTTAPDLATWAIAIADARAGRSSVLLSEEMTGQMLTPQKDGFGLGPQVGGSGRTLRFGHGGSNKGFRAQVTMFPELGTGAVVMTNSDAGSPLIREILRTLAAEYGWPEYAPEHVIPVALDSAAAAGLVGTYHLRVGRGLPAEVRLENGKPILHIPAAPVEEELVPESVIRFVAPIRGLRVEFFRDASGRATGITVFPPDNGPPVQGTRTR